jgi:hypothetical protein
VVRSLAGLIRKYEYAKDIVLSAQCLIGRATGTNAGGWGVAQIFEPADGYRYEIHVGDAFLNPPTTGTYADAVQVRVGGPRDLGLLQVTTLVHEAMHWYNWLEGAVPHRPGAYHSSLGTLLDPYNFEFYMIEISCTPPPALIDSYRAAPIAHLRPAGRTAAPATTGFGRSPGPTGMNA